MNPALLMEMLAARNASGGAANMAELMARMQGGGSAAQPADVEGMMARLSAKNPMLGMVFQQLADSNSKTKAAEREAIEAEVVEVDRDVQQLAAEAASAASAARLADVEQQLRATSLELGCTRERIDMLAAALGACALCWGQEPRCRACRGRGLPGFALPDEPLFEELILPAVQLLRAHRIKQGRIAPMASVVNPQVDAGPVAANSSH
jgi:hypothetical protein